MAAIKVLHIMYMYHIFKVLCGLANSASPSVPPIIN